MGEKLVVGPIAKGLKTDRLPFNIDNDSFPFLQNAYQWRGRIKRKRGTSFLNRPQRSFNSGMSFITLDGGGNGNLLTGFLLQSTGNIIPGSVTLVGAAGPVTYTDPTMDGYLTPTGTGGPNTIDYATGAILIPAQAGQQVTAVFMYFPGLPIMGLEDLVLAADQFPGTLCFDTTYAYNILTASPYTIYDVSFYKNPANAVFNGHAYTAKTVQTTLTWNGQDYQQFWSANYLNALWATNGITIPFTTTDISMQFQIPASITWTSATQMTFVINSCPLVAGDWVFVNEFTSMTGGAAASLNFQTGFVESSSNPGGNSTVVVRFPWAVITNATYAAGMVQYLTNTAFPTKDCIRWYDGDPTQASGIKGWVNFSPPLSAASLSIDDTPSAQYYLVGARIVLPFKDRLIFLGVVVQTSTGAPIYLQDTIVYSQNGTPFYTASFDGSVTGAVTSVATIFHALLVPVNQGAAPNSFFGDVAGYGGNLVAGFAQPIVTASPNEDVLLVGFSNKQTRLVYTGTDLIPFNLFVINSEFGSASTFSSITLDRGALSIGDRGIVITSQVASERIDLEIPDQLFEFDLSNNGFERVTAQRDFINEWIYFTYSSNEIPYKFPNQTLLYNYRDISWGVFNESYTTYGQFRRLTGETWATIGARYATWSVWNAPWNAGSSTLLQPEVIAGNQQGFVLLRDVGTNESNSLSITSFSGSVVTSPNHCLNNDDFIVISGCLGTIGPQVNGLIFQVDGATTNTFQLNPNIGAGTYFGSGLIQRMYVPKILTKQFPVSWGMARKTRIGPQQYLFTQTPLGQIELQIYLNQNDESAANFGPVIPALNSQNDGLIYSDTLFTCVESTNLGLTAANSNLQMAANVSTGTSQSAQLWHRLNTSLLGDTVQIGFTMNEEQMRDPEFNNQFEEIELHGFILDVTPSQVLA